MNIMIVRCNVHVINIMLYIIQECIGNSRLDHSHSTY